VMSALSGAATSPGVAAMPLAPSEPVAVPPVVSTAPAGSASMPQSAASIMDPLIASYPAGATVTTLVHEPVQFPTASSMVLPTNTTTYTYVGAPYSPPQQVTFGAPPPSYVAAAQPPLAAAPFVDPLFPVGGVQPIPTLPIGIPGGYDFKFYGPDEYNPLMLDDRGNGEAAGMGYGGGGDFNFDFGRNDHSGYGPGAMEPTSPPPVPPPQMQEADKYDTLAAEHERQAELLEQAPQTNQNLERQIQELLEGQRALRHELEDVKATVSMNYRDLEVLRREAEHQASMHPSHMQVPPYDYYDQGQPPQDPAYNMPPTMPPTSLHESASQPEQPADRSFTESRTSRMPPRNLGYEDAATNVLESLSKVKDHVTAHATALHGHATRSLKSIGVGQAAQNSPGLQSHSHSGSGGVGGSGGREGSMKSKLCGKACP